MTAIAAADPSRTVLSVPTAKPDIAPLVDEHGSTLDFQWLSAATCVEEGLPWQSFFVEAGHAINPGVKDGCRGCPVRAHCVTWAYRNDYMAGYSGGLSPSQRRSMSYEQALEFIAQDPPRRARG